MVYVQDVVHLVGNQVEHGVCSVAEHAPGKIVLTEQNLEVQFVQHASDVISVVHLVGNQVEYGVCSVAEHAPWKIVLTKQIQDVQFVMNV